MADDTPETEGKIITVTTDQPASPTFVVDDSKAKASIVTIFSLIVGGMTLCSSLLTIVKSRDVEAFKQFLTADTTVAWFAGASPFLWIGYRAARSWFKKGADVAIAKASPNAVLKSEMPPSPATLSETDAPPSTRAPETTTRLVGISALEAGGKRIEYDPPVQMAVPAQTPGSNLDISGGGLIGDKVSTDPKIPGDALDVPAEDKGDL